MKTPSIKMTFSKGERVHQAPLHTGGRRSTVAGATSKKPATRGRGMSNHPLGFTSAPVSHIVTEG